MKTILEALQKLKENQKFAEDVAYTATNAPDAVYGNFYRLTIKYSMSTRNVNWSFDLTRGKSTNDSEYPFNLVREVSTVEDAILFLSAADAEAFKDKFSNVCSKYSVGKMRDPLHAIRIDDGGDIPCYASKEFLRRCSDIPSIVTSRLDAQEVNIGGADSSIEATAINNQKLCYQYLADTYLKLDPIDDSIEWDPHLFYTTELKRKFLDDAIRNAGFDPAKLASYPAMRIRCDQSKTSFKIRPEYSMYSGYGALIKTSDLSGFPSDPPNITIQKFMEFMSENHILDAENNTGYLLIHFNNRTQMLALTCSVDKSGREAAFGWKLDYSIGELALDIRKDFESYLKPRLEKYFNSMIESIDIVFRTIKDFTNWVNSKKDILAYSKLKVAELK